MRFLADESCDFAVVRALRSSGHDVASVAESGPQTEDPDVIAWSVREDRILLTEDKDFGQLVYAGSHGSNGVLLLRYPANARGALAADVLAAVAQLGARLQGAFAVLEPGRVRLGRTPAG